VVLYPLSIFVLGWYLPLRVLATETAPPLRLAVYTLFATCIFFVRGSLPVWMAFSFSYSVCDCGFMDFLSSLFCGHGIAASRYQTKQQA
jgi:hypothetical protein